MTTVGIISVHRIKRFSLKGLFGEIEIKEPFGDEISYLAAECGMYMGHSSGIEKAILKRKIGSAEKLLKRRGAEIIAYTDEAERFMGEIGCEKPSFGDSRLGIPKDKLTDCFLDCYKKCEETRKSRSLLINDRNLEIADIGSLSRICLCARNISLRTEKTAPAERLAERIFGEFGVWIEVVGYDKDMPLPSMLIDGDKGLVRILDLVADGADYALECGEYNIDLGYLAKRLRHKENLRIKNWRSGKNIIKIS